MLLYSRMFDWIVLRINQTLNTTKEIRQFIGVLGMCTYSFLVHVRVCISVWVYVYVYVCVCVCVRVCVCVCVWGVGVAVPV